MTEPVPILETRDLTMRFGGVVAVARVNFSMTEGELRCLIGPNGAGKSTFFKMLIGQLRPTAGQVLFRGQDIANEHVHLIARRGVGIKTQVPSVFDGLTVRENIWVSTCRQNDSRTADGVVDQVLERIALTGAADRLVGQLAHGERQWVELGMALAGDPDLILLDEPTAGMTHEEVARTSALLQEINQTTSMIVVEHDMQFIKSIAEKVTVFHQGGVLVEGGMDAVLNDPQVRDIYMGKQAAA